MFLYLHILFICNDGQVWDSVSVLSVKVNVAVLSSMRVSNECIFIQFHLSEFLFLSNVVHPLTLSDFIFAISKKKAIFLQ
jgi:hypothetical protein